MSGLGLGALVSLVFFLVIVVIMLVMGMMRPHTIDIALRNFKSRIKMNMALICAACISTMVICGSLIAGDSLSESITDAVYDNLSEVDEVVPADSLFNGSILDGLSENESLTASTDHMAALIHMEGIAENPETGSRTRKANIIGFDEAFLDFGSLISADNAELGPELGPNEVYVNEILASEIGMEKGDFIDISFSHPDRAFEAIFLGEKEHTNLRVQFKVKDIVRPESLGRFQLNAQRQAPQNVFWQIESLQKVLGTQDGVNMILVSNTGDEREGAGSCDEVTNLLGKALDDVLTYKDTGLRLTENPEKGYVILESENIFFSYSYYELLSGLPVTILSESSPISTYFWNSLSFENRSVPYSTVCAFDPLLDENFGLFTVSETSQKISEIPSPNEIIINNWTAEKLQVDIGDTVAMNYSVLDKFYNIQDLNMDFTVKNIVNIEGKANDSMLMPSFPGIEGISSAFDWDPPFTIDLNKITEDDEEYWQKFKGTPKAFIALKTGSELWENDLGSITQVRLMPSAGTNLSTLKEEVQKVLNENTGRKEASITVKTIKLDALESASGIELFTGMFLAFSAACIIASAVLIMLLITLRIEYRATEIGTLKALGFQNVSINHIFLLEGTILSIIGGFIGTVLGLLFGAFLISGMNTFWQSIVEGSPVTFHFTMDSLIIGFCLGIIISVFTMMLALRIASRKTVIETLRSISHERAKKKVMILPVVLLLLGLIIILLPIISGMEFFGEIGLLAAGFGALLLILSFKEFVHVSLGKRVDNWAGLIIIIYAVLLIFYYVDRSLLIELFFLSGFLLLCGFLLIFYHTLKKVDIVSSEEQVTIPKHGDKRWILPFAVKNAARKPKRTMFMAFLFSLTLFVLVSLTINLQGAVYDVDTAVAESGGGYHIMGESTNPIFADLKDKNSRLESDIDSDVFDELYVEQFRTKGDVGGTCSNLNRAASPRIIGANESFFENNTLAFVSFTDLAEDGDNPWQLLKESKGEDVIPAIGDYNTIVWILGLDLGSTISVLDETGETIHLEIVAITGNSIFPGSLIIWDENFEVLYPSSDGFQLFLFRSLAGDLKPQISELESALRDFGFDAFSVESLVVENILIENTYIFIFQVILMFGLIIGTLGFGIVASRNALERRREIGILRAIGFSKSTIMKALFMENSYIILCAVAMGALSGIIASSVYLVKMNLAITSWPWAYVIAICATSYVIAMFSALVPILRASKMSVTRAIRFSQ
ncbi:MAG: ABC transporter permease [Methanomassiliicoccales archaeon]|nr:MAG: ABC transporter permease [Methanomassiliicoccales archaeon]